MKILWLHVIHLGEQLTTVFQSCTNWFLRFSLINELSQFTLRKFWFIHTWDNPQELSISPTCFCKTLVKLQINDTRKFTFAQYITILIFTKIDSGYLPVSPYTIQFGVLDLRLRINFEKLKCALSIKHLNFYSPKLHKNKVKLGLYQTSLPDNK